MNSNRISSWNELMQTLQFRGKQSACYPNEEEISTSEQKHQIIFPQDYKEFCKLFGSGLAGDHFKICCPGDAELLMGQEDLPLTINHIREFSSGDLDVDERKIDLLSNGFRFAEDRAAYFLMWDLRTYREDDSSYDLYWVLWDCPESKNLEDDIVFVGRSFFEFIRDFCYGSRINELYPSGRYNKQIPYTYYRL